MGDRGQLGPLSWVSALISWIRGWLFVGVWCSWLVRSQTASSELMGWDGGKGGRECVPQLAELAIFAVSLSHPRVGCCRCCPQPSQPSQPHKQHHTPKTPYKEAGRRHPVMQAAVLGRFEDPSPRPVTAVDGRPHCARWSLLCLLKAWHPGRGGWEG